jgi:hypothetical protein
LSRDNVDIVARLYNECWAPGKLGLVPEILHPDICRYRKRDPLRTVGSSVTSI